MKNVICLLMIILLGGCSQHRSHSNISVIKADITNLSNVSLMDIVDSISLVNLETTDSCLVSNVSKIIKKENQLYLFDQRQQTLFCFGTNGNFEFKISDRGQGPDEYQYIEDFTISDAGIIYLLEPWGNVFCYNNKGEFQERIKLSTDLKSYNEVFVTDSSLVFFSIWGDVLIQSLKNDEKNVYELAPSMNVFSQLKRSSVYNDKVRTVTLFDGKVKELSNKGVVDCYAWDFGEANNDNKNIDDLTKELINERYSNNKNVSMLDYIGEGKCLNQFVYYAFENTRYKIALMEYRDDFLHVFYDKKENKNLIFKKTEEGSIFHPCSFTDGVFVYCNQGFVKGSRDFTCLPPSLLISEDVKKQEEDNPLIAIFHLKK